MEPGLYASGDGAVSGADAFGVHGLCAGGLAQRHKGRAAVFDAAGRVSVFEHLGDARAVFLPIYDDPALRGCDV